MLDGRFAHEHDEAARRVVKGAARCAGIALGTGPDFFLHGVVNAFQVFCPQQLDDFTWAKIIIVSGRAGSRANAAIEAAVELVVKADVRLDVLEYFLQLPPVQFRTVGYRVADELLDSA